MSSPSDGRRRWPRRRILLAVLGLVVLGVVAAGIVLVTNRPGNVTNPDVAFDTTPEDVPAVTAPAPEPGPAKRGDADPFDDGFTWPVYGLTERRTQYLPLNVPLRPPFVRRWSMTGSILLEFTPVLCGRQLFLLKNNGALYAISRRTGEVKWKRKLGALAAASPACGDGTVYAPLLQRGRGIREGRVVAVDAADGHTRWSRKLPSRSESSPLLAEDRLYLGSEDGTVYALRTDDGAIRWTYKAGGAVKGALALDDGRLIFGDYGGQVTALRRTDGKRLWTANGAGTGFGRSGGNFYATPALAYGRVYIGSTDGFMYSFSAKDGTLAWRRKTGGYVYSSAAVAPVRGGTVYAGSYDGKLYAFDARTGNVKWSRDSGGKISGGVQVIGDLVFYANLQRKIVAAAGAATGKLVWSADSGAFNAAISDGKRLYVVAYSSLHMYTEQGVGTDGKRVED